MSRLPSNKPIDCTVGPPIEESQSVTPFVTELRDDLALPLNVKNLPSLDVSLPPYLRFGTRTTFDNIPRYFTATVTQFILFTT